MERKENLEQAGGLQRPTSVGMHSKTLIAVRAYDHVTTPFLVDKGKRLERGARHLKLKSREKVGLNKDPAAVELSKWRSSTASSPKPPTVPTRC